MKSRRLYELAGHEFAYARGWAANSRQWDTAKYQMFADAVTATEFYSPGIHNDAKYWIAQKGVWDAINTDTTIMDSLPVVRQFRSMATLRSRYRWLSQINNNIVTGDYADANAMLGYDMDTLINTDTAAGEVMTDVAGADGVVANYVLYYQLLMKYQLGTLSSTDSADLVKLANKCPIIDGAVIYQARALFGLVFGEMHVFDGGDCESLDDTLSRGALPGVAEKQQHYTLFPNPTDGHITLRQSTADTEPVFIEIYNAVGKSVLNQKTVFLNRALRLDVAGAAPGLYLVKLSDSEGKRYTLKFAVQ